MSLSFSLFRSRSASLFLFGELLFESRTVVAREMKKEKKRKKKNRYKGTEDGKRTAVEFARECG